jgi:hypothetical protein
MGKVNDWFAERLAWVENLYDSDYKQNIIGQLEAKRDHSLAGLQERSDAAQADMDDWRYRLASSNADIENELWTFHETNLYLFDATTTDNFNDFTDTMDGLYSDFSYGVEDNIQAKDDFA